MAALGDFDASTVVYGKFTTYRPSTGAAYTLGGTPALSVYKDNSTTQSTTGVTLVADFDSVTGLNHFAIDTSADGTFYSAGSFFDVVVTTGTVDSVSVVGAVVGSFTLRKTASLKPATAGRTLVVDASGLADANAVKLGPSGSGTAQTARDVGASVLISSGTGTGQLDVTSGVIKSNLSQILGTALTETSGQIAAAFKKFFNIATPASTMDALTLVATATNLTNAPTAGDFTATMKTSIGTAVAASAVASVTGNVGGNVAGSVGSVTARVTANTDQLAGQTVTAAAGVTFPTSVASPTNITAASGVALTAAYDPAKTAAQAGDAMTLTSGERTTLAAAIWNALTSGLTTVSSIGKLLVDNINATISSRLASSSYSAAPTAADNASAVWDEALAGHATAGSAGAALSAAGGGADAATIAAAVWDEATAGHQTAGSTGKALTDAQSAGDPWASSFDGHSAGDILKFLAAALIGKTSITKLGNSRAQITFRAIDDSADRVVGTADGSMRTGVTLTP